MSWFDRLTGRTALLLEIDRLRQDLRAAREQAGSISSNSSGLSTISGLNAKILQLTREGVIGYANSPMAAALGRSKTEVIGRPIAEVDEMPWGKGDLSSLVKRATSPGGPTSLEVKKDYFDPKSGHQRYEIVKVIAQGDRVQILIEDVTDLRYLEESFKRYVSPAVLEKMKGLPQDFFRAERYDMTVLFADLRGFTSLSEKLPAEDVRSTLNQWLSVMTETIEEHDATVDKFVGDEVMAILGAPIPFEDHAERAIRLGLAMQEAHKQLMASWQEQGKSPVPMGIGINSGEMVIGNIGSKRRVDYTVIGYPVNLASRLVGLAQGGQILIGAGTLQKLTSRKACVLDQIEIDHRDPVRIKGISQEVGTFLVRPRSS